MRFLGVLSLLGLPAYSLALWPQPKEFTHGNTMVWLSPSVQFTYNANSSQYPIAAASYLPTYMDDWMGWLQAGWLGINEASSDSIPSVNQIVNQAILRTQKYMRQSQFVPWKFYPRGHVFEPSALSDIHTISEIVINENSSFKESLVRDYINGNETYQIEISESGGVSISTYSAIGTLRALQTFQQLFYTHSAASRIYTPYAPVFISDSPKWQHRGLNLDICRNVFSPKDVRRTIDAMASAKMNRLHVHATDSQSWPIDIPSMPSLADKGAYHPDQIWSPADLHEVQLYGLERGVSVFLEIDLPGHTAAVGHAYPDLVVAFHMDPWEEYAAEPPGGQLKLNSSKVHEFLASLMTDLLPRVSPLTEYFHTGGDEFNLNTYLLEKNLASNDQKILKPLLQTIVTQVHEAIHKAGLTPIVWEELVLDWNLELPSTSTSHDKANDVIIQVWRDSSAIKKVLERGYRTIFGSNDAWYLDCGVGSFLNPRPGSGAVRDPFLDYCSPLKNWRHVYVYDPLRDIPEELQHLIIGGESHMWSEQVDPTNMDQMIWPRAASAAEVLWTGPRNAGHIRDASYRLGEWRERVVTDMGVGAGMVQMTYCLMRESGCDL